jgi:hypothetical protein
MAVVSSLTIAIAKLSRCDAIQKERRKKGQLPYYYFSEKSRWLNALQ